MSTTDRPRGRANAPLTPQRAMKLSLYYLGQRACTQQQLNDYLLRKGFPAEMAAQNIARLISVGYLDDHAFAHRYIETRLGASGLRKLQRELANKGVHAQIIEQAVAAFSSEQYEEGACAAARAYLRSHADTPTRALRTKAYASLARRGYTSELIRHALDATMPDDADADDADAQQDVPDFDETCARARDAAASYLRAHPEADPYKQRRKTWAALARRGFSSDVIRAVVQEDQDDQDDQDD